MSALLGSTLIRNRYLAPYVQLKRQSAWIIELAHLLEPPDQQGCARKVRQIKREIKQFLKTLEQEASEHPDEVEVVANILKAVRHRWWGLFTCYQVPNVPASNNDLEAFFKDMKHHQRRITGHKSVHEFVLRYGPFAAFIDYVEPFDDLLTRLRQVKSEDFKRARQALQTVQLRQKKLYRFRHHPDQYFRELETRWEKAISSNR